MTPEQREARKKSATNGNIRWIKDNCIRTKDGPDDYVFISYKSDSWQKVLDEIVYTTCKKYGLHVFFDTNFDEEPEIWVKQFQQNMTSTKCKAIIAFIDDKYYSSYATLMEVMASRNKGAGGVYDKADNLLFLPINLESPTSKSSDRNTGLGTERFSNGSEYPSAKEELDAFNTIIKNYQKSHKEDSDEIEPIYDYNLKTKVYYEKTNDSPEHGEVLLNESQCRALMKIVIPKKSENYGTEKSFEEVIHDKLKGFPSVFGPIPEPPTGPEPPIGPEPINEDMTLESFSKLCEDISFCAKLREVRNTCKKQIFDFFIASILRGCDNKVEENGPRKGAYNYCLYVISEKPDFETHKLGASQYTWESNSRKAMRKEDMPESYINEQGKVKSGTLGEYSTIFEHLSPELTIGSLLEKYRSEEKGFRTKDNGSIIESWEKIKTINMGDSKFGIQF